MSRYLRSVAFRVAGGVAGVAIWFGLIVLALTNFDTPAGFPEDLRATWPFWLVAAVVVGATYLVRRRLGAGPGWGMFALGMVAPFLGLLINARFGDGGGLLFWLPILIILLVPIPALGRGNA